jgi:hypothetical protein
VALLGYSFSLLFRKVTCSPVQKYKYRLKTHKSRYNLRRAAAPPEY